MMVDKDLSSGFLDASTINEASLSEITEIYTSQDGYNSLYRCQRFGRLHVLKALQPAYRGQTLYETALHKEFVIGYQLEHPNICHILGWEHLERLGNCILMEYIDGITLKELISHNLLTRDLAYKIIEELCSALSYMHSKQVVHRDLKPSNILITHNGNNLKLIDFGLSDCDDFSILKQPAGTRYYLAPEVLEEGHSLDLRIDIYSLGVILGEMAEYIKDKQLATISRKCTQRKPERRYSSMLLLAQAAKKAYRQTLLKSVFKIIKKAAVIAVVLLICSFAAYRIYLSDDSAQRIEPITMSGQRSVCLGGQYRHLLAEKKIFIRQHRQMSKEQRIADSTLLACRLQQLLDIDFPLSQQKQSHIYLRQRERIHLEIQQIYR
jgi:serine/threonine protein kinase